MESPFSGLLLKWSSLGIAAIATVIISIFVWWIIRKRLRDFWLPIIRVLSLPVSRLPRITLQRPPLIPFLLFSLAATVFAIWSVQPTQSVFTAEEPGLRRVHVFIDMSPSVSAHVSVEDLGKKLVSLLGQVGTKARVSFGTSHGDNVYELSTPEAAAEVIGRIGFHRGGAKIGSGVRGQLAKVGDIDQLFVLSDRDQYSWSGFEWKYLTVDAEVRHVDVDDHIRRATTPNIFVQDVRFLSPSGSATMDWEVELSLGVLSLPAVGIVTASAGGEVLATANWEIQGGRRSTLVNMSWPAAKITEDIADQPIEWVVEVTGGDLLQMDNKFLSPMRGRRDRVVIVGEPSGELRLEDPLVHLETALRVAGYDVSRYDRWPPEAQTKNPENFSSAGVVVAMGGDLGSLDYWCPTPRDKPVQSDKLSPLWVAPRSLNESFSPVCHCLARFDARVSPDMCGAGLARKDWIALLRALGAKQVGGELGSFAESIAMMISLPAMSRDLLLFTIPVRPMPEVGISWGVFPIMVKDLIHFTLGQMPSGGEPAEIGAWPRIADVSRVFSQFDFNDQNATEIFRTTNVPVGESILSVTSPGDLPSSWLSSVGTARDKEPGGRQSEDATLWVRMIAFAAVVTSVAELIWMWYRRRRRPITGALVLMFALGAAFFSDSARAQARIQLLGIQGAGGSVTFNALAKEVSSRTSLELSPAPEAVQNFDESAAASPWLWTKSTTKLTGKNGVISDAGRLWLKRGGILILDGPQPPGALEKFMEPLMVGTVRPTGWVAMPPDHEFMRSFYLLNALPTCKGRSWRIFSFDGRVAAIESPYSNLDYLQDRQGPWLCESKVSYEQNVRIFVNLMMLAFTTDYKRDQIHLPEILKRLRVP